MADTVIRVAQIWAHRAETDRHFFVQRVEDGVVHGMDYHVHASTTRTQRVPVEEFVAQYVLVEDTPAGLLDGVRHG